MPSIIHGYEYDIFISYRQKDNKTGWVTEFVKNLKNEIEATFKEDISIYFDSNPHDGLHETHDVDGSLKQKVKCIVFIPIVSQTYCDPKSFAWRNEFLSFLEFAEQDELGLDVKLSSGNVTKRILPVRIHELDPEDQNLYESKIGGVMRPVDFIYKETGVNRPLKLTDDRKDNLEKVDFYNQINKVALAIKEILKSIQTPKDKVVKSLVDQKEITKFKSLTQNKGIIITSLLILLLLVVYLFLYRDTTSSIRVKEASIAVLPFDNLTGNESDEHLALGFTEEIINQLSQVSSFSKVISRTSVMSLDRLNKSMPEIARELGVAYILEGSFQKSNEDVKITVQLIDGAEDNHIWSDSYTRKFENIFDIQAEIATEVSQHLRVKVSGIEHQNIEKRLTNNIQAYQYYIEGMHIHKNQFLYSNSEIELKASEDFFLKAINLDPGFALAYAGLADLYDSRGQLLPIEEKTQIEHYRTLRKKYVDKAYQLDSSSAYVNLVMVYHYLHLDKTDLDKAYTHLIKMNNANPNNSEVAGATAQFYVYAGLYDEVLNFGKRAVRLDPLNASNYPYLTSGYMAFGKDSLQQIEKYFLKAMELEPDNLFGIIRLSIFYACSGQKDKLQEQIQRLEALHWTQDKYLMGLYYASFGHDSLALSYSHHFAVYSLLGEHELAIDQMESIFSGATRSWYQELMALRIYDPLKNLPKFQEILGKEKVKMDLLKERYAPPP